MAAVSFVTLICEYRRGVVYGGGKPLSQPFICGGLARLGIVFFLRPVYRRRGVLADRSPFHLFPGERVTI